MSPAASGSSRKRSACAKARSPIPPCTRRPLAKPLIGYEYRKEYRKRLHGDDKPFAALLARHVRNIALDPFGAAAFLLHLARKRAFAVRKFLSIVVRPKANLYSLEFNAKQEPNPDSRVRLLPDRDRLGMQRITVDWRHTADA